jgi:hypothetical protein
MKFQSTGLKQDPIVEAAYDYALAHARNLASEVSALIKAEINLGYQKQLDALNAAKDSGQLDEERYKGVKAQLDKSLEFELKRLPLTVAQEISFIFDEKTLAPALELQEHSENTAPEVLAAALLLESVRDPLDYQKVESRFGGAIAGMVAEILHIDSYPGDGEANTKAASSGVKRILMANLASGLDQVLVQVESLPPGMVLQFPPKQEEKIYSQAKLLWGNDKKQDLRLRDVFNRAAEVVESPFRIEVKAGKPLLVKESEGGPFKPNPNKKGPRISGDNTP